MIKKKVRRVKYIVVLAVANQPDLRGIIFPLDVLQNIAKHGIAGNYQIQIGDERYKGRKLYMSEEQLICEFAV